MRNLSIVIIIVGVLAACVAAYYFIGTRYLTPVTLPEAPADASADVGAADDQTTDLLSASWSWQYTDHADGTRVSAPAGDRFILSFDGPGRVTSTTDCNNLGGSVSIDGEVISMGQFISTLMYCEGSVESQYATDLSLVNSYVIDGDTLRFNLNRDYGTMTFTRVHR